MSMYIRFQTAVVVLGESMYIECTERQRAVLCTFTQSAPDTNQLSYWNYVTFSMKVCCKLFKQSIRSLFKTIKSLNEFYITMSHQHCVHY